MTRYLTFLFLVLASSAMALPVVAKDADSQCIEGPPMSLGVGEISSVRTAQCPYDFTELESRLMQLSIDKRKPYSVETVEQVLGIPEMTTSDRDPRVANYQVNLSGKDGWKLAVSVQEGSIYPPVTQPRFVPGPRPKRLADVTTSKLRVTADIAGSTSEGARLCMPTRALLQALINSGWKDIRNKFPPPLDGDGRQLPIYANGHKTISLGSGICTQEIVLLESPPDSHLLKQ